MASTAAIPGSSAACLSILNPPLFTDDEILVIVCADFSLLVTEKNIF